MNVQQFVADTLVQIASAIDDANARFAAVETDALASPPGSKLVSKQSVNYKGVSDTQEIEFDIAVTVEQTASTQGEGGVGISVLKLRTQGQSTSIDSHVSRIRFSIPLRLPMQRPATT